MMGIPQNLTVPFTRIKECYECGETFKKREKRKILKVYDDPFALKPRTVAVHIDNDDGHGDCFDRMFDTSWSDFRYFTCDSCNRIVARQRADNGWRSHVKIIDDEEICIDCYQKSRLENGDPLEAFDGHIPGDFYNSSDISAHKWTLVSGFSNVHITGRESVQRFCDKAKELIRDKFKVLVDHDSMAYGGIEGYVSLYCKR